MNEQMIRRLVALAYERGWRDACDDHLQQVDDSNYPIGRGKHAGVSSLLVTLDPYDVLGLRCDDGGSKR